MPSAYPKSLLFALTLVVAACSEDLERHAARDASLGDAGPTQDASDATDAGNFVVYCDKMDVLFVIDNSASMRAEQQNLSDNFASFVDALRAFRGRAVDFRIGVTTTAFPVSPQLSARAGEAGALLQTTDMQEPWLRHDDPNLAKKFQALATVGTGGNWDEQPLKALVAALEGPTATQQNAGFLRADALLAVVILSDEDDLSMNKDSPQNASMVIPVEHFVQRLNALKGDFGYWTAAIIAGGTVPMCRSSFGEALFAARLQAFANAAGSNVVFSSICEGDLSLGLNAALKTFESTCNLWIE